jgi:hypothetical protein
MRKLLSSKKLFCIPWLLAGDTILVSYPDKFDSPEYQEMLLKKQEDRENYKTKQQTNVSVPNIGPTKDQLNKLSR